VIGAGYSRESTTRDDFSAGIVFLIPLYQGGRVDARNCALTAQKETQRGEVEKFKLELADPCSKPCRNRVACRQRPSRGDKQNEYRDWALERARAGVRA